MAKKRTPVVSKDTEDISDSFELDGNTYCFVIKKFHIPDFEESTAKEALTNPELLKYLVKIKSGVIKQTD
jgi:hypothetical protein